MKCNCMFEGTPCSVCKADVNSDAFAEFMEAWALQNARVTRRLTADEISDGNMAALAASSQV